VVTIHGTGFTDSKVLEVSFGRADALRFHVVDDHEIRATTPPANQAVPDGSTSDVNVVVSGLGGAAFATQTFRFGIGPAAQGPPECEDADPEDSPTGA